ncbi:hypothetical protein HPB50_027639 [Hyalomma asiaticum]|nr:hypothetical protein HPB50_027639 [Hyalomma asiaticum]
MTLQSFKLFLKNKRRAFREERKKILHIKSGQPTDDVYVGKWKFFNALRFLEHGKELDQPGHREQSKDYEEECEISGECEEEPSSAHGTPVPEDEECTTQALSPVQPQPVRKKRKGDPHHAQLLERRTQALEKMAKCMEQPPTDASSSFGVVISDYLNLLPL